LAYMIEKHCVTREWIDKKRAEIGRVDPILLEKCIRALVLLSALTSFKMPFVFKGGTSLILLIKGFRRLSIDVDIVTDIPRAEYELVLKDISRGFSFTGYEEDKRGERGLPKRAHFKFFYDSVVTNRSEYVLLDILEEKNLYPKTKVVPVRASILELSQETVVTVPTLECLLGDKLTAFAPNTIGISYHPLSSMQIIKQLFDVGEMFNVAEDMGMVVRAYEAIARAEIGYRGNKVSAQEAIEDTFQSAVLACGLGLKGVKPDERSELFLDGIKRVGSHLVNCYFRMPEARLMGSRVALLATMIKARAEKRDLRALRWKPEEADRLELLSLSGSLEKLNRIRQTEPEAFYNLHTAQGFLGSIG